MGANASVAGNAPKNVRIHPVGPSWRRIAKRENAIFAPGPHIIGSQIPGDSKGGKPVSKCVLWVRFSTREAFRCRKEIQATK